MLDDLLRAAEEGDPLVLFEAEDEERPREFLLHHPDAIRHVLQKRSARYVSITPPEPRMGRLSLAMSHGDAWRRRRRLLQPLFQPRRIARWAHHTTSVTARRCERWRAAAERGEALAIDREMIELALETLLATFFGEDASGGELKWRVNEAFECFNARARGEALDEEKLERSLEAMGGFLRDRLARRRAAAPRTDDLLGALLEVRDSQSGAASSDEEIFDELMMMMVMGHMSTAMALTWTCDLWARHPRQAERLAAEVDSRLAGRTPDAKDLDGLAFCGRFLDEALRLYPTGWAFSRRAVEDDEIAGFPIPAGSIVILSPWVTHRRPDLWRDPRRFDPDRFLSPPPPFAYFPFGGGPRNCIGASLAKLGSRLILAQLAQSFRAEPVEETAVEIEPNIALMPRGGLSLVLRLR